MKYLKIPVEFEIGQIVYLKTEADQSPRIVTGYRISGKKDEIIYEIQYADANRTEHYGFELSDEKDVVMYTSN